MTHAGLLDMSRGAPALSFNAAAEYAYRASMSMLREYDDDGRGAMKILNTLPPFLNAEMGLHAPGTEGVWGNNLAVGNGTSELYAHLIAHIADEVAEHKVMTGNDVEPVILMPVPTYGLFFRMPREYGLQITRFPREPDGSVCPQRLDAAIRAVNGDGNKRVVAYFDSNPNNPTGYIRGREETQALAQVILAHNSTAPAPQVAIRVVDDMVYFGNEYDETNKPSSFMGVRGMADNTFVLAGGSKVGLAALRIGILVGNEKSVHEIRKKGQNQNFNVSFPAMHALSMIFPVTHETRALRREHLRQSNAKHRFSGQLMRAMINGMDAVDATGDEKKRIVDAVSEGLKISPYSARQRLKRGMDSVRVTTDPQAGFFHMLDFSDLQGSYYTTMIDPGARDIGAAEAKDEIALEFAHAATGLKFCSGTYVGLGMKTMQARTTFAMEPPGIVEAVRRMGESVKWFAPTKAGATRIGIKSGMPQV